MAFNFILPDENGQEVVHTTENTAIIIIGANGSGKSRLGAWIEEKSNGKVHRIGAQRSLVFGEYIQQKSYEQAKRELLYGHVSYNSPAPIQRWGQDLIEGESRPAYTTVLLQDFEFALSALIAKFHVEQTKFVDECRQKDAAGSAHNHVPCMVTDDAIDIWRDIFPQRQINFTDAKVTTIFNPENGPAINYRGNQMSDGERVVLYLIAQALCIPENMSIVIDEPEIHIHRSIMNRLWDAIERKRPDCFFIYITHDTEFAANHQHADKFWVKSFDGRKWDYQKIEDSTLPEQLLLDVLGNRKPVLFVEGTRGSYDVSLYAEIYKGYYIVPCGSCTSVIQNTKALRANSSLHHLKIFGLIDRDFRGDGEIEQLKGHGVFCLGVAEVENLFLSPELLEIMANQIGREAHHVEQIKSFIIEKRYKEAICDQSCKAAAEEIRFLISRSPIPTKESDIGPFISSFSERINTSLIIENKRQYFNKILEDRDYDRVLSVFNEKNLSNSIGHYIGLENRKYCDTVLRLMKGNRMNEIKDAIKKYLPNEIPIDCE